MKYNLNKEQLKLTCINLSDEIKKDDKLLNNKDVTIFNSSILELKNSIKDKLYKKNNIKKKTQIKKDF